MGEPNFSRPSVLLAVALVGIAGPAGPELSTRRRSCSGFFLNPTEDAASSAASMAGRGTTDIIYDRMFGVNRAVDFAIQEAFFLSHFFKQDRSRGFGNTMYSAI